MATVSDLYPNKSSLFNCLQSKYYAAQKNYDRKFSAVLLLQRMARGYLIRKYVIKLNKNALIIQCAFRMHAARKAARRALREKVRHIHRLFYDKNAIRIQAAWRGYDSRRKKFCYRSYKRWLKTVKERGERKAAEALEFKIRSRADDLRVLENDARQWLAFVVFKLHHLLRTFVRAGVYSDPASNELSEFEKLLKMIHFTEYMKKLKRKYAEFVRKYRPMHNCKQLFPVIGEGTDYWYLSLTELYDLTLEVPRLANTRNIGSHHSQIHSKPFLWKKISSDMNLSAKGPFYFPNSTKAPPAKPCGDHRQLDPRFNLYVKHYTPKPDIMKYVDYHINIIVNRKHEILSPQHE